MSDLLVQIAANQRARRLIKGLGLPLPLPPPLRRASEPWQALPLDGWKVVLGRAPQAAGPTTRAPHDGRALQVDAPDTRADRTLAEVVTETLAGAGATAHLMNGESALPADFAADALVFDASEIADPRGLRALYDFFHPLLPRLRASGRVVVLGRPESLAALPEAAAAQAALAGFVRSLAREIGRKGATAQLFVVHPGAETRIAALLRFVLSARAAFLTGQVIAIDATVPAAEETRWVSSLTGKVALVTGAARGIGEATARLLSGEGAHVVCLDRPADESLLAEVARAVGGGALVADVSDAEAPVRIRQHLMSEHGGVDIVVHNAGVTRDKTLVRMEEAQWNQAIDINLAAVARIDNALVDSLLRDRGRIIGLASVSGLSGNLGQTNYAASKAGLMGYVRKRSAELAPRGITVNAVAPGFIETRLTSAMPFTIRQAGRRLAALQQGGVPRDVAEVITFLATPGAAGITGAVVRICGGALMGA